MYVFTFTLAYNKIIQRLELIQNNLARAVTITPVLKSLHWLKIRDVPVIHPVPGMCRISHYSVLPGPGKIMGPSNKQKFKKKTFLLFITVTKKSYGIVDKNIFCRIKNIQSYKLVFCVQYFLIFTVSCSSCHSLKSVSRTLFMLHR